jgi:hypothetical protein
MDTDDDHWVTLKNLRDDLRSKGTPETLVDEHLLRTYQTFEDLDPISKETLHKTLDKIGENISDEEEDRYEDDEEEIKIKPKQVRATFTLCKSLKSMIGDQVLVPTKSTREWLKQNPDRTVVGFIPLSPVNMMPINIEVYAGEFKETTNKIESFKDSMPLFLHGRSPLSQGGTEDTPVLHDLISSNGDSESLPEMEGFSDHKGILKSLEKKTKNIRGKKIKKFIVDRKENPGFFKFIETFPNSDNHAIDDDIFELSEDDATLFAKTAIEFSSKKLKASNLRLIAVPAHDSELSDEIENKEGFSENNKGLKRSILMGDEMKKSSNSSKPMKNENVSAWLSAPETASFANVSLNQDYSLSVSGVIKYLN